MSIVNRMQRQKAKAMLPMFNRIIWENSGITGPEYFTLNKDINRYIGGLKEMWWQEDKENAREQSFQLLSNKI